MMYGSRKAHGANADGSLITKVFTLDLSEQENSDMLAGKPVKHLIGSATQSGVITVTFKKNSAERHKQFIDPS